MTRNLYLAATAAAAFAFASPALAQDASSANPAPAGFRIEAVLGYDRVGIEGIHGDGFLYGIGAGYDLSLGGPVSVGVDGEISDSTAKKFGIESSRDLYAGGRVNVAVGPRANFYVKGGYTNARFTLEEDDFSAKVDGFRIGAGGQYMIAGNTYVGAEYRYSNYESGVDRNQVAATIGTRF